MIEVALSSCMLAVAETVQHRITSGLVDGFSQWWQMPALVLGVVGIVGFVLWMIRRDSAELSRGIGTLLALLRLGAVAALVIAYLDVERTTEHEVISPSRVAVLVDSSASMTLADERRDPGAPPTERKDGDAASRSRQAIDLLVDGGLLDALTPRHEVSLWRFDADAEPIVLRPSSGVDGTQPPALDAGEADVAWGELVVPRGFETRLGDALVRVIDQEPAGVLAGVIVLSDGATNAGLDPVAAVGRFVDAEVPVFPIGIGSDRLPTNVRVADLVAPARVFPGDRFAATGYVQAQGLAGQTVTVELSELPADDEGAAVPIEQRRGRVIDTMEVVLGRDGELSAVRFDVPGLETTGRRLLMMRVKAPTADRVVTDDVQLAEVEVVERVTQVLLMAGGPSREYQFMLNVLARDKSFMVDVILGTASEGISQDARKVLPAFPASTEALDAYDCIVAFDYDWRLLDSAAQARLETWVARESGGLIIVAGGIFMEDWVRDPRASAIRDILPVETQRSTSMGIDGAFGSTEPMPLTFTRDGQDAEFLWLAASRIGSQTVWSEFPGVFSSFDASVAKPGATVYAWSSRSGGGSERVYMAGQFYGSGSVFYLGSGELWRLRSIEDAVHERLVTQLVRYVSQGRLLRGSRRARLLVDRDRFAVGATVAVRLVAPEGAAALQSPSCTATGPDGGSLRVPLVADPDRPGSLRGGFVAAREGTWLIDVDLDGGAERISKRIQARLPDRELERPRLDRGALEQVAALTGGRARFLVDGEWTAADAEGLSARLIDRSRREYQTGAPDTEFKRRLNALLMGCGASLLCIEWIVRRLVRLA